MTAASRLSVMLVAATSALAVLACGPVVGRAPFPKVPGSVKPGDLVGPYDGQVVAGDTGKPVHKATVWCSWGFERGIGTPQPYAARTFSTVTDVDGRYRIPLLGDLPSGLSTRLARFTLRVYKKGYVLFDRARTLGGARPSPFSQHDATVKLSRWTPELSHAEHLLFAGGDAPLTGVTRWERAVAARELDAAVSPQDLADSPALTGTAPDVAAASPSPGGLAATLLSATEVRSVSGYEGELRSQPLGTPGDTTDTLHFRAVQNAERFDVGLRLWRLTDPELTRKYEGLVSALSGRPAEGIGDRSFIATQGEILGLVFFERSRAALVLLTCGQGQCSSDEMLLSLGRIVSANLDRLPSVDAGDAPQQPDAAQAPRPAVSEPDTEGP